MTLSSRDLSDMQADLTGSLPDSGTILRLTRTSDGMGGGTVVWTAAGTAACRVSPGRGSRNPEFIVAERVVAVTYFDITFPAGTDVDVPDRVQCLGVTYEVQDVSSGRSWEIGRRVLATQVD